MLGTHQLLSTGSEKIAFSCCKSSSASSSCTRSIFRRKIALSSIKLEVGLGLDLGLGVVGLRRCLRGVVVISGYLGHVVVEGRLEVVVVIGLGVVVVGGGELAAPSS